MEQTKNKPEFKLTSPVNSLYTVEVINENYSIEQAATCGSTRAFLMADSMTRAQFRGGVGASYQPLIDNLRIGKSITLCHCTKDGENYHILITRIR